MRRFLGGNLATSTGASGQGALNGPSNGNNGSTPESSSSNYVASGSQSMAAAATAAASASAATRRALQTTWQQFRANSTKSSTSQSSDAEKSSSNGKDSVSCTSSAEIERIDGMERKAQSQSSEASADSVQEDWNSMLLPFSERTKTTANEMDSPAQMPPMPTRNYAKLDVSTRYTANASSMVDLKNEMLLELLSSDAMVHVGDFEILGLDEVEDLRKEHSHLSNRLNILLNKLEVESKIRDATVSMSKLYSSKRLSRQADDQIDTANRKVASVEADLSRIAKRESEIRTRLLRHMAAILALSLQKSEAMNLSPSSAASSAALLTPTQTSIDRAVLLSPTLSTGQDSTRFTRFEGAHLYAGNKDASIPVNRSPFTASLNGAFPLRASVLHRNHSLDSSQDRLLEGHALPFAASSASNGLNAQHVAALEEQIADLTTRLQEAQAAAEKQETAGVALRTERSLLSDQIKVLEQASEQNLQQQQKHINKLLKELEQSHADAGTWEKQNKQMHDEVQHHRQNMRDVLQAAYITHTRTLQSVPAMVKQAEIYQRFSDNLSRMDTDNLQSFLENDLVGFLADSSKYLQTHANEVGALREELKTLRSTHTNASSRFAVEAQQRDKQIQGLQQENGLLETAMAQAHAEKGDAERALHTMQTEFARQRQAASSASSEQNRAHATALADMERAASVRVQEAEKMHAQRMQQAERSASERQQDIEQRVHDAEAHARDVTLLCERLQDELEDAKRSDVASLDSLRSVWAALPTQRALQARLALDPTAEVSRYVAAYTARALPHEDSASLLPQVWDSDAFALHIEAVLVTEAKLVKRLAGSDEHAAGHKASSERAQRLLHESTASLQTYASQVKELRDQRDASARKQVEMLEKVNEHQDALEQSKSQVRRAEGDVRELMKRVGQLEKEKMELQSKKEEVTAAASQQVVLLQREADELKEDLTAAQDEVDELRNKESRQRVQLLEELSTLTEEASSLRAQLRTAQRKLQTVRG